MPADPRAFGFDSRLDLERLVCKLTLLAEYARLQHEKDGCYALLGLAVMLEDMLVESDATVNRMRQEEATHARQ